MTMSLKQISVISMDIYNQQYSDLPSIFTFWFQKKKYRKNTVLRQWNIR
jgi:hypothetical protein